MYVSEVTATIRGISVNIRARLFLSNTYMQKSHAIANGKNIRTNFVETKSPSPIAEKIR
jgi:hypothetical protein